MYIVYQYHKYCFFKLVIFCDMLNSLFFKLLTSSFLYSKNGCMTNFEINLCKIVQIYSGQNIYRTFFLLQQQQTSFEDRFLTSILLEPRSLVFVCDDMYKTYLHGISERTVDKISNSIANIEMCEMAQSVEALTRTTRVSLTIRHVPKVLKAKFLFGKKWFCWIFIKTVKITYLYKFIFLHQERNAGCLSLLWAWRRVEVIFFFSFIIDFSLICLFLVLKKLTVTFYGQPKFKCL